MYIIASFCQNQGKTLENKNSPEYIQTSLAASISLGFEHGRFKEPVKLTGLNLLLTYENGCIGRCAYCGISTPGHFGVNALPEKKTFIRVKWPVYKLQDVLTALKTRQANFERACLSMITHRDALSDTLKITEKIKKSCSLPISLLISPTLISSPEILKEFKGAGVEMAGVAVDASTREIFEKYRGRGVKGPHKWEKYWEVLEWSVEVFGKYNAGIHLIAGLGETEKEAVDTIYDAYIKGAKTHLFSFYPEACSGLENLDPPELLSYRKIQVARYLINEKNMQISKIKFDNNGNIASFDYDIRQVIDEGYAFMTSGCPCSNDSRISACNRPFANERPSEVFRNYPYIPSEEDKQLIEKQISCII